MKVINKDASGIIKQANQKSPLRAVKIKKTYKHAMESVAPKPFSSYKGLAIMLD